MNEEAGAGSSRLRGRGMEPLVAAAAALSAGRWNHEVALPTPFSRTFQASNGPPKTRLLTPAHFRLLRYLHQSHLLV